MRAHDADTTKAILPSTQPGARGRGLSALLPPEEFDGVPEEQRVPSQLKLVVATYLVLVMLGLVAAILWAWPSHASVAAASADAQTLSSYERGLLLVAVLAGGVGATINALHAFTVFVGNRSLRLSWIPWYFVRPMIGMGLALLVFFVLAGVVVSGDASLLRPFGVAAISALAGLFSKRAVERLALVCDTLFQPDEPEVVPVAAPAVLRQKERVRASAPAAVPARDPEREELERPLSAGLGVERRFEGLE